MDDLAKKCIPCEGGIPPFDKSEIHKYLKVDGWDVKSNDDSSYYLTKDLNLKILFRVKILLIKGV